VLSGRRLVAGGHEQVALRALGQDVPAAEGRVAVVVVDRHHLVLVLCGLGRLDLGLLGGRRGVELGLEGLERVQVEAAGQEVVDDTEGHALRHQHAGVPVEVGELDVDLGVVLVRHVSIPSIGNGCGLFSTAGVDLSCASPSLTMEWT